MALYTLFNKTQISEFAAAFGLPPPHSFKGILAGTVNTYYRLTYPNAVYYLKVDEIGNLARLKRELSILGLLVKKQKQLQFETPVPSLRVQRAWQSPKHTRGIAASPTAPRNGQKRFIPYKNKFILLFPEVSGKSYFGKHLTPSHLKQVGQALARLHKATQNAKIPPHRFHLAELKRVFSEIKPRLLKKHPKLAPWIQTLLKPSKSISLPEGLIHADLFPENILFEGKKLNGILDFEAGGRGSFMFDVCVAIHACCHDGKKFIPAKIKAFLLGYQSVRKLTSVEKKNFKMVMGESALRFLLTRLRDFELKEGPVKAKPFKDYREYVRRFDEIEKIKLPF